MYSLSFPQLFAVWALPVLFAITVHEVAHGWVASKFGDKTALLMGRITLNPIKHIDLVGTIIVPSALLLLGSGFIFGWAKPVPVNWYNLNNPRRDMALVAAAGPISNLLMALAWAMVIKLAMLMGPQNNVSIGLSLMGQAGVLINLVLMVLNLIPIPPLDGSRVVTSFLSQRAAAMYSRIEPFGFFVLLFLLVTGVLGALIGPVVLGLRDFIFSFIR